MKLRKPSHPDPTGTGLYYSAQACHRKTASDLAIAALAELPPDPDPILGEMSEVVRAGAIQAVIQAAWMREYHYWETDTKSYFDVMHVRNGKAAPTWKKLDGSHVEKVRQQINVFAATPPASLALIDETRNRVNGMKHEDSHLASRSDYEALVAAVDQFWQDLESQEAFTPPPLRR